MATNTESPIFEAVARRWIAANMMDRSGVQIQRAERMLIRAMAAIGGIPINEITQQDIHEELASIVSKGSNETANRTRRLVARVFDYAIEHGLTTNNPTDKINMDDFEKVEVIENEVDVDDLRAVIDVIYRSSACRVVQVAIVASILLIQKPGHIRAMEWSEIVLDEENGIGMWVIPASKTGTGSPHSVPLVDHSFEAISDLKAITGRSRFVFPSPRDTSRCISNNSVRKAMIDMGFTGLNSGAIRKIAKDYYCRHAGYAGLMDMLQGLSPKEAPSLTGNQLLNEYIKLLEWWSSAICTTADELAPRPNQWEQ